VIVIDASALAKYVLHEEGWEAISTYIRRRPLYSVDHIIKEVGNAIWKHCYLRRIVGRDEAMRLYRALLRLVDTGVIILEPEASYAEEALKIALQQGLTLYDSLYLAQARRLGELLTSDERQAEAAAKLNVKVHLVT